MTLTAFARRRPVTAFWVVAVALELVLIPVFLLAGADSAIERGLESTGLDFNTDLVTAARVVEVVSPDLAVLVVAGLLGAGAVHEVARRLRFWAPEVGIRRGLALWLACVPAPQRLSAGRLQGRERRVRRHLHRRLLPARDLAPQRLRALDQHCSPGRRAGDDGRPTHYQQQVLHTANRAALGLRPSG